ncbi:MAG: SgcJ/EcaC family oxidoreductase [Acidobacteria bacterium]|nr:SgcJ/EcaC family oxidoreductase [Acidobacteriota bacterium]
MRRAGTGPFHTHLRKICPLFVGLLWALSIPPDAQGAVAAGEEVETLLAEQAAAWSRGDVEAFCSAYAEDVVFVSPSGLTRGRQQVVDRYKRRYPDRAAMGTLTLEVEEVRLAGGEEPRAASVVARWRLSYPDREPLAGLTLLVLHRDGDGTWKIVQDASM